MRTRMLRGGLNVAALAASVQRLADPPTDAVMQEVAKHEGPSCAAYLVWIARKFLHRVGEADFNAPEGKSPPWFRIALEHLKNRPGWSLVRYQQGTTRHVRLVWHRWGNQWPESRAEAVLGHPASAGG